VISTRRILPPIKAVLNSAVKKHVFPGCVFGMVRKGDEASVLPIGRFTYENTSPRVRDNSIYDVASITKSIPVACLALKLIEDGHLNENDRLIQYVLEFTNPDRKEVHIKHLLTHTLNFGFRLSWYKDETPEKIMNIIFHSSFEDKPGEVFCYSNATSILLGLVLERVCRKPLDQIANETFFRPLEMERTSFRPLDEFHRSDIVPTEFDTWRGRLIQGEVHDESNFTLQKANGEHQMGIPCIPGSAGLFSTVPDLLNFLQMLLMGGSFFGKRILSQTTISRMYSNQIAGIGECTGLGWELGQPQFMGRYYSEHTFGKTGFTGCLCMCDVSREIGFVLLSNCTYPHRKNNNTVINRVRRAVADIIFSNL
jgi:CubicO group peptidase (beta-lactamase class C family)